MRLRIGHSPDPDDAFMAWALAEGIVRDPAFEIEIVTRDVQTLNEWAVDGKGLDVTALSLAAYAQVTDEYVLLPFGASFGEGYGPVVVAAQPLDPSDLAHVRVAGPGALTTAAGLLKLAMGPSAPTLEHVPFEDVLPGVKHALFDAGLLIHEGQITFEREGLVKVLDLGDWWAHAEHGLPLPLGVVAVRRDVGEDLLPRAAALVKRAIEAAFANRAAALNYASKFGRGLAADDVERFVDMYVTALSRDMRPSGARAIERAIERLAEAGLAPSTAHIEFAPEPEPPNPHTLALVEESISPVQADDPAVVRAAAAARGEVEAPSQPSEPVVIDGPADPTPPTGPFPTVAPTPPPPVVDAPRPTEVSDARAPDVAKEAPRKRAAKATPKPKARGAPRKPAKATARSAPKTRPKKAPGKATKSGATAAGRKSATGRGTRRSRKG